MKVNAKKEITYNLELNADEMYEIKHICKIYSDDYPNASDSIKKLCEQIHKVTISSICNS